MPQMSTSKDNPVTAAYASGYLTKLTGLLGRLDPQQVETVGRLLHRARAEGRQVFLMGNGGSAALASHVASDHMGRIEDTQLIVCHILLYGFMDVEGCG